MTRKEDPFLLVNYRFLPDNLQKRIDLFLNKLDDTCRKFAHKRYIEGKTFCDIAEEMGYVERSLYSIRSRILALWDLTFVNNDFEHHCNRVLGAIKRYGAIDHYKLADNLSLRRSGLSHMDLKAILDILLIDGDIKLHIRSRPNGGRPKRTYVIANSGITRALSGQNQ
ncbi:MAG: hypothetical protein GX369_08375 [Euryarchaeota archaeon]|nr:hypothetical protein [Euryarchaeota archaeon]